MKIQKVFSFWRIVFSIGWAKSLTWAHTSKNNHRHIYIFSIHVVERDNNRAIGVIIGPIAIALGIVL